MTGRIDVLWRIFEKIKTKMVKIEATRPQKSKILERFQSKLPKTTFFRSCDLILNIFALFSNISTLPVILSFMQFCLPQIFLVELRLDDVLEVLLVVG